MVPGENFVESASVYKNKQTKKNNVNRDDEEYWLNTVGERLPAAAACAETLIYIHNSYIVMQ